MIKKKIDVIKKTKTIAIWFIINAFSARKREGERDF